MRIIVAGGAGFIGHSLCLSLLMSGIKLFALTIFTDKQEENLQEFLAFPDLSLSGQRYQAAAAASIAVLITFTTLLARQAQVSTKPVNNANERIGGKDLLDMARETGARFSRVNQRDLWRPHDLARPKRIAETLNRPDPAPVTMRESAPPTYKRLREGESTRIAPQVLNSNYGQG